MSSTFTFLRKPQFKALYAILIFQLLLPVSLLSNNVFAADYSSPNEQNSEVDFYFYDLENQSLPLAEALAAAVEIYKAEITEKAEDELSKQEIEKRKELIQKFKIKWIRDNDIPREFPVNELSFVVEDRDGEVLDIVSYHELNNNGYYNQRSVSIEFYSPRSKYALLKISSGASAIQIINKRLFYFDSSEPTYLKCIDLQHYEQDLGRARIPAFRVPLSVEWNGGKGLGYKNGVYSFGNLKFNEEQLKYYIALEEVAYNLTINLLDKDTYVQARETVLDLDRYFARGLDVASEGIRDGSDLVLSPEADEFRAKVKSDLLGVSNHKLETKKLPSSQADPVAASEIDLLERGQNKGPLADISSDEVIIPSEAPHMVKYKQNIHPADNATQVSVGQIEHLAEIQIENRTVKSKLRWLRTLLTMPRAQSSNRLLGTFVKMEEEGLLSRPAAEKLEKLRSKGGRYWNSTLEKVSSIRNTIGSHSKKIATALLVSSAALLFLHPAAAESLDMTVGIATHVGEMVDFLKQPGELARMLVRVGLGGFGSIAFIASLTHFSVVFHHIYKDWKSKTNEKTKKFKSFLKERQARLQEEFEKSLIPSKKTQGSEEEKEKKYTEEQDELVRKILSEQAKKGIVAKASTAVGSSVKDLWNTLGKLKDGFLSLAFRISKDREPGDEDPKKVSSFGKALMHSMFSMASFTDSQRSIIPFYNKVFFIRSFARYPLIDMLWLRHPNAAKRILGDIEGLTLPTVANGGLRSRVEQFKLWGSSQKRKLVNAWEEQIVATEKVIEKKALREASSALVSMMDTPNQLHKFYAGAGIDSVSDPEIMSLPKKKRLYFSSYYAALQEEILVRHLKSVVALKKQEANSDSLKDLKEQTLEDVKNLSITEDQVERYVQDINSEGIMPNLVQAKIKNQSWGEGRRWKAVSMLDPKNSAQTERIQSVKRKLLDPVAVGRAVRQALSGIFIDKPLEFFMMVICLMSVDTGINKLFTSEFFSSDSIFYLGRFPFLMGFVFGTLLSVAAEAWMKLQIDEGNEENFGEVPEGKDAERSRLSWFFKQTFRNKDNNLLKNHIHLSKLVWANIPAYLTMIIPIQLLFLGRAELDTLVVGYIIYFMTVVNSMSVHLDQGFEFSSFYDLKDFPDELRDHPEVLKHLNKMQTKTRFQFNLFAKTYENFVMFFVNTLMTLQIAGMGTKSFIRSLFGGFLPAEWVLNTTQSLENAATGIPVAEQAAKAINGPCEFFLEKGYTDGTRLIPPVSNN